MTPTPAEIAWAHTVEENNRQRYLVRRDAEARRRGRPGRNERSLQDAHVGAAAAASVHRPARRPSETSGETIDWRTTALALAVSVVILPIALIGYLGIAVAVQGWRRIRRG